MATNGVTHCTICSTEDVFNTKRNHISVECDMKYHSPKLTWNGYCSKETLSPSSVPPEAANSKYLRNTATQTTLS